MAQYIDTDRLKAEIERRRLSNRYIDTEGYESELIDIIDSLQQDEKAVELEMCSQAYWEERGWMMIPPDVTLKGIESLLEQVRKKLQQEQPEFINKIWHKVSEEANLTRPVVLSDGDKYMSPPCTFPFKDMSGFVNAMNKRYKADYTIWAYMDDLLNISSLQQERPQVADASKMEQPEVDLVAELKHHLATTPKEQLEKEWKELEPWSNIGPTAKEFLYGKSTEWSEDLDAEVKRFFDECVVVHAAKIYGGDTVKVIAVSNYELTARHFAEWGAEHARKEK